MGETHNTSLNEQNRLTEKPNYMLLEKTKAFYTLCHPYLEQFPKTAKFTIRAKIEDSILEIIKLLIFQNYQQDDLSRRRIMLKAIMNIHVLGVLLQQAVIFKYISIQNFERIESLHKEISAIAAARYRNLGGQA